MVHTEWPLSPAFFGPHLKVQQILVLLRNQVFEKFYVGAHLQSQY